MSTFYRILRATRNAGSYQPASGAYELDKARAIVESEHPKSAVVWRKEGADVCAYLDQGDIEDEDKAIARIRPL